MNSTELNLLNISLLNILKNHPNYNKCWDQILKEAIAKSNEKEIRAGDFKWIDVSNKIKNKDSKLIKYSKISGSSKIMRFEILLKKEKKILLLKEKHFPSYLLKKTSNKFLKEILRFHEIEIWKIIKDLNGINLNNNKKTVEENNSTAKFNLLKKMVDKIRLDYKKEINEDAKGFLQTTIGAGIFYLGTNCSGIISKDSLKNILFNKFTLSNTTKDHIFPRKEVGSKILDKKLTLEDIQNEHKTSWSQVAYVTKNENQKTKNEFTTSGLNDYKIIRKAYIDFFEKNYQMIDTKLYDIRVFNCFIEYLKAQIKKQEELTIKNINGHLKIFNNILKDFKTEYSLD
jgi:hypothetical protein